MHAGSPIWRRGHAFEKIRFGEAFTCGIEAFLAKRKPDFSDL